MTDYNNLIELVHIPAGTFLMGLAEGEVDYKNYESPQHLVTVPEFLMGKYPVTQAQWRAVATGLPKIEHDLDPDPSYFTGDTHPVEQVNWYEAVEFCNRLSQAAGREYRLPSEAEREYACRAGTTTPFHFGETITTDLANYDGSYPYNNYGLRGEYRGQATPVGSFPPNGFGLYDMHGNVWEWCQDVWHDNYEDAPTDGSAWDGDGVERVLRGGSWDSSARGASSAKRGWYTPYFRLNNTGFRVCCSAPRTS